MKSYKTLLCVLIGVLFAPDLYSQYLNKKFVVNQSSVGQFAHINKNELKLKSPTTAFLLSSGTTLVSAISVKYLIEHDHIPLAGVVLVFGTLMGPSIGNVYAENKESVNRGIKTRLVGTLIATGGLYLGLLQLGATLSGGSTNQFSFTSSELLLTGGTAIVLYSMIYDFINAPLNAKKYNQAQQKKFSLRPSYNPINKSIGLSMNINF